MSFKRPGFEGGGNFDSQKENSVDLARKKKAKDFEDVYIEKMIRNASDEEIKIVRGRWLEALIEVYNYRPVEAGRIIEKKNRLLAQKFGDMYDKAITEEFSKEEIEIIYSRWIKILRKAYNPPEAEKRIKKKRISRPVKRYKVKIERLRRRAKEDAKRVAN